MGALKIWDGTGWTYAETGMGVLVQGNAPSNPVSGQLWLDTTDDSDPTMGGLIADSGWIVIGAAGAPPFQNAWTNYGSPFSTAAYRKINGVVRLRGLIASGTMSAAAFTLPAGYRPTQQWLFGTISNSSIGRVDVTTAGVVMPSLGSNAWYALDGLSFPADA